jgi:CBS domain-containing protein
MLTTLATEVMSTPVITITADKPVSEAARIMLDNHVGLIVVVDESGPYVGV